MPAADRTIEPTRGPKTICIPCSQEQYERLVDDPVRFREFLDQQIEATPALGPPAIRRGYRMKDTYTSRKTGWRRRRIDRRNHQSYSVRPSFLMPYLTGRTEDVQAPLSALRKFAVPFWALTEVFGRHPMYWHRLECSLGRFRRVGTTVQAAERLPRHLVADEKHTTLAGKQVYRAATAGGGCCLGMALAESAGNDDLEAAYGVFRDEARHLDPGYRPETVNTDGWPATQAGWRTLFQGVTIILGFLHAFLKIRDRAKPLKGTFDALRERVWGRIMPRMPARSRNGCVACGSGSWPTWTSRSSGSRCGPGAPSGRRSWWPMPIPVVGGRATRWTACCGDSITT